MTATRGESRMHIDDSSALPSNGQHIRRGYAANAKSHAKTAQEVLQGYVVLECWRTNLTAYRDQKENQNQSA